MFEYDEAPLRPFHLRIAIASTGGVFSDGFGLGIIGIALSRATPLALSPVWMGLLGGASLFGLFAGALFTGPVADRFGRRPIFSCNMAVLGVLSLLQGLVGSAVPLLLLRLAIGFLLGIDYVVSKALLTEFILGDACAAGHWGFSPSRGRVGTPAPTRWALPAQPTPTPGAGC